MLSIPAMKILLVDDHSLFREGLRHVLHRLVADAVILETGSGTETLALAERNPDLGLILLDLSLPDMNGIQVLAGLRDSHPDIPVVVLSGSERLSDITAVIERGGRGYIPKSSSSQVLLAALRVVFAGAVYIPSAAFAPSVADRGSAATPCLPELPSDESVAADAASLGLTPRQQDVLKLIVEGKSNKHIARELGIEESTVKVHVSPVLKALKVTNRVQAVLAVSRLGIRFDSLYPQNRCGVRSASSEAARDMSAFA